MAKARPQLAEMMAPKAPTHEAVTEAPAAPAPKGGRPHVSLYISRAVQWEIKTLAHETGDRKPHELYLEAIDLLLQRYGRPSIAEIDAAAVT